MTTITRDELLAGIDHFIILEALPPQYFRKGHIPGAQNFPHTEVDALAPRLLPDKDAEIVVYCANAECANSGIAAERLAALGYRNVRVFAGGKKEWEEHGLPLRRPVAKAS